MSRDDRRRFLALTPGAGLAAPPLTAVAEKRNEVGFLRGPYNLAFYRRHNRSYRISAEMHFFHSKQHDLLQRTPGRERRDGRSKTRGTVAGTVWYAA